jgi:hypothetical protein
LAISVANVSLHSGSSKPTAIPRQAPPQTRFPRPRAFGHFGPRKSPPANYNSIPVHDAGFICIHRHTTARFDRVPESLQETIKGIGDLKDLRNLLRLAARCTGIEDFASIL